MKFYTVQVQKLSLIPESTHATELSTRTSKHNQAIAWLNKCSLGNPHESILFTGCQDDLILRSHKLGSVCYVMYQQINVPPPYPDCSLCHPTHVGGYSSSSTSTMSMYVYDRSSLHYYVPLQVHSSSNYRFNSNPRCHNAIHGVTQDCLYSINATKSRSHNSHSSCDDSHS